jgi:hypothetical protein
LGEAEIRFAFGRESPFLGLEAGGGFGLEGHDKKVFVGEAFPRSLASGISSQCLVKRIAMTTERARGSLFRISFAVLDEFAIECAAINPQEVSSILFLALAPLQCQEDIFTFEIDERGTTHKGCL